MKTLTVRIALTLAFLLSMGFLPSSLHAGVLATEKPVSGTIDQLLTAMPGRVAGSHSGEIFFDLNRNGIREFDELGASNVTVRIETKDGQMVEETSSDSDGFYLFTNLAEEEYMVQVVPPKSYQITSNGQYPVVVGEVSGGPVPPTGLCVCLYLPGITHQ